MSAINPQSAVAKADGTASCLFQPPGSNVAWIVSQVSVEITPNASAPDAFIRMNGRLITATIAGALDAATGEPTMTVTPADQLVVSWANVAPGSICIATIVYDEKPLA